jgi:DNA-directed RNA polymerase subunit RPC12/RpoP
MSIFDRLKHGVDLTKFKADQLLHINRIKGEIDVLLQDTAQIQKRIAAKTLELHQAGNLAIPELEKFCLEIDSINRQIREKEAQIAAIRAEEAPQYVPPQTYQAVNPCPTCGFDIPLSASFCPNCGYSVKSSPPATPGEESSTITCPTCGYSILVCAAFCPECGEKIIQPDLTDLQ